MVWRIEKNKKMEWNRMGRMVGTNMGLQYENLKPAFKKYLIYVHFVVYSMFTKSNQTNHRQKQKKQIPEILH